VPFAVLPVLGLGLLSFAFSPILIRYAATVPATSIAVWRTLFAVLMLAPFAAGRIHEIRRLEWRELRLVITGGVMLALHFLAWIESLYHTTVASASVLVALSPIFLAILGYFLLKERLGRRRTIAIAVAVAGAVLIGVGDAGQDASSSSATGNALALLAALLVSFYLLVGRVVRRQVSWLVYVFVLYSVAAATILIFAVMSGAPLLGFDMKVYGLCALMAIGPQIAGHGSFNYAIKFLSAALLGLLSLTEPIGGSVLAYFLFDELPGPLALLGMVVVLVGVGVALRPERAAKRSALEVPPGIS
jgi:drug/metabolite transporter (DMT)-like permease